MKDEDRIALCKAAKEMADAKVEMDHAADFYKYHKEEAARQKKVLATWEEKYKAAHAEVDRILEGLGK